MASSAPRGKYITKGVDYWLHPQHKNESTETKKAYLQSKGLTDTEIKTVQRKADKKSLSNSRIRRSKPKSKSRRSQNNQSNSKNRNNAEPEIKQWNP